MRVFKRGRLLPRRFTVAFYMFTDVFTDARILLQTARKKMQALQFLQTPQARTMAKPLARKKIETPMIFRDSIFKDFYILICKKRGRASNFTDARNILQTRVKSYRLICIC